MLGFVDDDKTLSFASNCLQGKFSPKLLPSFGFGFTWAFDFPLYS
jgi:hypothetical protein